MRALLLALLLGVASIHAFAQPAAVIEGVQMPAWRERAGTRLPLVPGMELRAGDRIVSGKDARIVVKLSEGSLVKLGENGRLVLSEVQPAKELFKAVLQVLEGAFRFTTDIAAKARKREVTVRVEQVTIGVRGTDFWGRSRAERQIVCLIEGAIQVGASGEQAVTMNQPRQFYVRDKGKTQPVGLVEEKQFGQWALETDIQDGKGALRRGGRFSVQLAQADKRDALVSTQKQLSEAGYPAEIAQRKQGDKASYVVRIRQLPSREEAQALINQLKGKYGVKEPRVSG
ncbi:MAG TPA: FecR domain-containing protein [Burkholderiales bacterium]|nr:FecR domain-containing protein [Burkholderiales bacterium]